MKNNKKILTAIVITIFTVILVVGGYIIYTRVTGNNDNTKVTPVSVYLEGSEKDTSDEHLKVIAYTDDNGKLYLKNNRFSKIVEAKGIDGKVTDIALSSSCAGTENIKLVALTTDGQVYVNKYTFVEYDFNDDEEVTDVRYGLDFIKVETNDKITDVSAIDSPEMTSCSYNVIFLTKEDGVKYSVDYQVDSNSNITSATITSKTYDDLYPFTEVYGTIDAIIYVLKDKTITYNNHTMPVVDENGNRLSNIKEVFVSYGTINEITVTYLYIITSDNKLRYILDSDYSEGNFDKVIAKKVSDKTVKEYREDKGNLTTANDDVMIITYTDNTTKTIKLY